MSRSPLALMALLLASCAARQQAVGPENDAFAAWGAPPPVVVEPGADAGAEAVAALEAWLRSPADWRTFDAERLEAEVLRRTNRLRDQEGLKPLAANARLAAVARSHSVEMSLVGALSHTSPMDPRITLEARVGASGIRFRALAENVASEPLVRVLWTDGRKELYTWAEVAANAVRNWAASPPHREALLRPDLKELGVGAALATDGDTPRVYLTQDFLR